MRSLVRILSVCCLVLAMVSCTSYKRVPYFQNSAQLATEASLAKLADVRLMPKDQVLITVNTTDPEASLPFNLTVQSRETLSLGQMRTATQSSLLPYVVSNDGTIEFPVVGTLAVGGLTLDEVASLVRQRLVPYLKETPVVTVRLTNFHISVLGEVAHPGQFSVNGEKINVLEALALAGDLTIWGRRDNVKLIREAADGTRRVSELDLTDAALIQSPWYQLEQNDILYVTPNQTKAKNSDVGTSTSLWFSATSIVISLASLLYNILH